MRQIVLSFLLVVIAATMVGCATDESQNVSSRPWGYRSGYDPGLPSSMNEGR